MILILIRMSAGSLASASARQVFSRQPQSGVSGHHQACTAPAVGCPDRPSGIWSLTAVFCPDFMRPTAFKNTNFVRTPIWPVSELSGVLPRFVAQASSTMYAVEPRKFEGLATFVPSRSLSTEACCLSPPDQVNAHCATGRITNAGEETNVRPLVARVILD